MQQFTRYEFKYQMPPETATAIRARLAHFGMEPDPGSLPYPRHIYPVTSLYFDTPTLDDYHDKAAGFLRRKKIRVRIYAPYLAQENSDVVFYGFASPSGHGSSAARERGRALEPARWAGEKSKMQHPSSPQEIWLEKKEKHEMLVSKKRVPLTLEEYDNLLFGSRLDLVQKHPIFLPLLTDGMRPTAMVRYQREPLVSPHQSNLRITFDARIEACQTNDLRAPLPMVPLRSSSYAGQTPDFVIMEVKFSFGLPFWFKMILEEFNLRRQSFSKYGEALEALHRFHPIPR